MWTRCRVVIRSAIYFTILVYNTHIIQCSCLFMPSFRNIISQSFRHSVMRPLLAGCLSYNYFLLHFMPSLEWLVSIFATKIEQNSNSNSIRISNSESFIGKRRSEWGGFSSKKRGEWRQTTTTCKMYNKISANNKSFTEQKEKQSANSVKSKDMPTAQL